MTDEQQTMSNQERLIYMANQIARNFATLAEPQAVESVAQHIRSFWDPRMREQIAKVHAANDPRLEAIAAAAVARLRQGG